MGQPYTLSMDLNVYDKQRLYQAACRKAKKDGLPVNDWRRMRKEHGDPAAADLIMLLDPGVVLDDKDRQCGLSIENSTAASVSTL